MGERRVRIVAGVEDAVWHDLKSSGAYEWWYFDAVSEDGRTAIVFIWFAGLPFSPDYLTAHERGSDPTALEHTAMFAAVYRDGRQIAYALNRHDASDFSSANEPLRIHVGSNTVAYGPERIAIAVACPLLLGGSRLAASLSFEPRSLAGSLDFGTGDVASDHVWNPIAPSCDVTGTLTVTGRDGAISFESPFRGAGYHDHNYGRRPLTEGIARWHWGRAHAGDRTFVFYHTELESGGHESVLAAYGAAHGGLVAERTTFEVLGWRRRILCPRFPARIRMAGRAGGRELAVTTSVASILDWGPFYMRFLTDYTIVADGERIEARGISEYLDPRGLRARWLRPLIKTRIRRLPPMPASVNVAQA